MFRAKDYSREPQADAATEEPTRIPHSVEAEEAVVGSVLINEFILDELADLQPEDFYIHRLRFIWDAYARLRSRKSAIDSLTVSEELEDMGRLEDVGGAAYLAALLNQVPTTLHAESYAQIILACSTRRRLLTAANKIATLAYDTSTEIIEVMDRSSAAVNQAIQAGSSSTALNIAEAAEELYDRMVARATQQAQDDAQNGNAAQENLVARLPSPWNSVNELLRGGFGPGRLYVVAGRPGEGKSSWMAGAAKFAAQSGKGAVIYSLEMDGYEVVSRIMAAETRVSANVIDDGIPQPDDWENIVAGMEQMSRMTGGWAEYTPSLTPARLRAKAHRIKAQFGLDLLILDYIQLMRGDGGRYGNREQEIASISRELKILAGELRVPILAGAQLSRDVEKRAKDGKTKEPELSDLRESGAIENDADAVIFLWRQNPGDQFSNVKFAKHRNGPVGTCLLRFEKEFTQFLDVE